MMNRVRFDFGQEADGVIGFGEGLFEFVFSFEGKVLMNERVKNLCGLEDGRSVAVDIADVSSLVFGNCVDLVVNCLHGLSVMKLENNCFATFPFPVIVRIIMSFSSSVFLFF